LIDLKFYDLNNREITKVKYKEF